MPEAQTLDNTPESILKPTSINSKLDLLVQKHFPKGEAKVESKEDPVKVKEAAAVSPETSATEAKITSPETPPVVETPKEDNYLEQKQKLIRRENELRKSAEVLKRFKEQEPQYQDFLKNKDRIKEFDDLKAMAQSQPTLALEKLGLSYDRITQDLLNRNTNPKSAEQLRIEELEAKQSRMEKTLSQKELTEKAILDQQAINSFIQATEEELHKDFDKYELTLLNGQSREVVNLRAEAFQRTNQLPKVEEPGQLVESWFEKNWLPKISESKKLQNYLISQGWVKPNGSSEPKKPVVSSPKTETRTLSNELTTGSTPSAAARSKNREERLAELIRAHQV